MSVRMPHGSISGTLVLHYLRSQRGISGIRLHLLADELSVSVELTSCEQRGSPVPSVYFPATFAYFVNVTKPKILLTSDVWKLWCSACQKTQIELHYSSSPRANLISPSPRPTFNVSYLYISHPPSTQMLRRSLKQRRPLRQMRRPRAPSPRMTKAKSDLKKAELRVWRISQKSKKGRSWPSRRQGRPFLFVCHFLCGNDLLVLGEFPALRFLAQANTARKWWRWWLIMKNDCYLHDEDVDGCRLIKMIVTLIMMRRRRRRRRRIRFGLHSLI